MFLGRSRAFEPDWSGFLLNKREVYKKGRKKNRILALFCFLPQWSNKSPSHVMTLTDVVPHYSNPPTHTHTHTPPPALPPLAGCALNFLLHSSSKAKSSYANPHPHTHTHTHTLPPQLLCWAIQCGVERGIRGLFLGQTPTASLRRAHMVWINAATRAVYWPSSINTIKLAWYLLWKMYETRPPSQEEFSNLIWLGKTSSTKRRRRRRGRTQHKQDRFFFFLVLLLSLPNTQKFLFKFPLCRVFL